MAELDVIGMAITTLDKIGETGPIDRDINGMNANGTIRGQFDVVPVGIDAVPTYPVLWSHDADRERTMCFSGDREGIPRRAPEGKEDLLAAKVENVWATATHCHFNLNFQFNSQSTSMQFTSRTTIGGRAWQSIKLSSDQQEKALVAWANTSLGMLLRWWHSNKQQGGRGNIGKTAMQSMPLLDVTTLQPNQLVNAVRLFDEMCDKPMLPLHEIDKDTVRHELDERFGLEVLDLHPSLFVAGGPLEILRLKLAQEPSIRGNK